MFKKITLFILTLAIVLGTCGCNNESPKDDVLEYEGKTIILHTNDVHGALEGYSYINPLREAFTEMGASVITVDNGDYSDGSLSLTETEGALAFELMDEVGYDIAGIGNHDFAFGVSKLLSNFASTKVKPICANLFEGENLLFDADTVIETDGIKIGFFGLATPETYTKVNPAMIKGLTFKASDDMFEIAKNETAELRTQCDIVICLAHLGTAVESTGNRSTDLYENVSTVDFIIDGHSHTVMEKGDNNEPIQSTGTGFENIGVIQIDNKTKKIEKNYLVKTDGLPQDEKILTMVQNATRSVNYEYKQVFAKSEVFLDGARETNRTQETNLGDLVADSLRWYAMEKTSCTVADDHVVGLINGGAIRANLNIGDITKEDAHNVLPFGNTLSVVYVKGSDLLKILEASTFCSPDQIGGFPQVAGIEYTIDTAKDFDQGDQYPDSTYHDPKTVNRVTINSVNGKAFEPTDTYAVVTNDFCESGGDTYYLLKSYKDSGNSFNSGVAVDTVLIQFITEPLGGVIVSEYSEPLGRIHVIKK